MGSVTPRLQAAADQVVVVIGRRMSTMRKVQVGVNAPIAEAAALFAKRLAGSSLTVYSAAMSGVYSHQHEVTLFRCEWDAVADGASFPIETVIDLMSGREGIDDEPVHPLQIDSRADVNLSGVTDADGSYVLFGPGAAGTDVLPYLTQSTLTAYLPRADPRSLVRSVSVSSGTGFAGRRSASTAFTFLVTDQCVLRHVDGRWCIDSLHEWARIDDVRAAAGFEVAGDPPFAITEPPSDRERTILDEVDPHNLRTLEFVPAAQRVSRVTDLWRAEQPRRRATA